MAVRSRPPLAWLMAMDGTFDLRHMVVTRFPESIIVEFGRSRQVRVIPDGYQGPLSRLTKATRYAVFRLESFSEGVIGERFRHGLVGVYREAKYER